MIKKSDRIYSMDHTQVSGDPLPNEEYYTFKLSSQN